MSSVLRLQVVGGLCSRLRAVLAAMGYCELTGRRLVVDWPRAAKRIGTFDARPSDLWRDLPWEVTDERRRFPSASMLDLSESGDQRIRTWKISTFGNPHDFPQPLGWYFHQLEPTAEIEELAITWWMRLRKPRVGVVIRSTIPQPSFAPVDWFLDRMAGIQAVVPTVQFFLAADDAECRSKLMAAFPGVVESPEPYEDYGRGAIIQQAANLQVLKRTDWVVGTNQSSYAQMVAFARGGQYEGPEEACRVARGTGGYEDAWNRPAPDVVEAMLGG